MCKNKINKINKVFNNCMTSFKLEVNGNRENPSIVLCLGFFSSFFLEKQPKDCPLDDTSQHLMFRGP